MKIRKFCNTAIDYALSLTAAVCLSLNLFEAFLVPTSFKANLAAVSLYTAALLLLCMACFYSRKSTAATLCADGLAAVCMAAFILPRIRYFMNLPEAAFYPLLFHLIVIGSALAVFICAKGRIGLLVLFLGGSGIFTALQYLGYQAKPLAFLIFLGCTASLFVKKTLVRNGYARTARQTLIAGAAAVAAGAAAVVLSLGIFRAFDALPIQFEPLQLIVNIQKGNAAETKATLDFSAFGTTGKLGGKTRQSDATVMSVTAQKPFYLVGRRYGDYTGQGWRPDALNTGKIKNIEENDYLSYLYFFGSFFPVYVCSNRPGLFQQGLLKSSFIDYLFRLSPYTFSGLNTEELNIHIQAKNPGKYLLFPPNCVSFTSTDFSGLTAASFYDAAYHPYALNVENGQVSYHVVYVDADFSSPELLAIELKGSGLYEEMRKKLYLNSRAQKFCDALEQYSADMQSGYTSLPAGITPRTRALAQRLTEGCSTPYEKAGAIEQYLKKNYTYTLDPPQPKKGEDFVDYFLFTGKKGYCVHFASAAAVLLRAAGVPARYVEGYVSPPKTDKNGVYQVTQRQAHAWVEAYADPLGFFTVDATPSAAGNGAGQADSTDVSSQVSSESSVSAAGQTSSVPSEENSQAVRSSFSAAKQKTGNPVSGPQIAVLVIGSAVFLILLWLAGKKVFRALRMVRIGRYGNSRRAQAYYGLILQTLSRFGLERRKEETPGEYARRLLSYPEFADSDFVPVTEIYERAAYGGGRVTDGEMERMKAFYGSLAKICRAYAGTFRYIFEYFAP